MTDTPTSRRNRVYKSLHKPLTYLGIQRTLFFFICVAAVGAFNMLHSLMAGFFIFLGASSLGYWATNTDPAFLKILGRSEKFRARYDAAKQQIPNVEIR